MVSQGRQHAASTRPNPSDARTTFANAVAASTTARYQYVWDSGSPGRSRGGGRYIDSPVLRDEDLDSDGDCTDDEPAGSERLCYANDANFNVTALVETDGAVAERTIYDAYGQPTLYDATWTATIAESASKANELRFCGHVYDAAVGLYTVRYRVYDPTLGRWVQRDPAGYVDGLSLFEYTRSTPSTRRDPVGLASWDWTLGMLAQDAVMMNFGEIKQDLVDSFWRYFTRTLKGEAAVTEMTKAAWEVGKGMLESLPGKAGVIGKLPQLAEDLITCEDDEILGVLKEFLIPNAGLNVQAQGGAAVVQKVAAQAKNLLGQAKRFRTLLKKDGWKELMCYNGPQVDDTWQGWAVTHNGSICVLPFRERPWYIIKWGGKLKESRDCRGGWKYTWYGLLKDIDFDSDSVSFETRGKPINRETFYQQPTRLGS